MIVDKKGFTLVEMIVTITILGVVTLISLPVISTVQSSFSNTKYENYKNSLESAAKLYIDSNAIDEFGNQSSGCVDIPYSKLLSKNLIEDIDIEGVTCADANTFVRVKKANGTYGYDTSIVCKKGTNEVYNKAITDAATSCEDSIDESGPSIKVTPNTQAHPQKKVTSTITLSDSYGFNANIQIKYKWINVDTGATIGSEKTHNFKNKAGLSPTTLSLNVDSPSDTTAVIRLVVTPVYVVDFNGNKTNDEARSIDFKIDNEKPVINIKASVENSGAAGEFVKEANNTDLTITDWKNYGYYFDFTGSTDNYGITKQTWKWNKANNVTMVTNYEGGNTTDDIVTNKTITGHGARYATVTMCDGAGNCNSKNIKVNISTVYTVKYDGNGGEGSVSDTTCYYGINCQLANNGFTKTGNSFNKWNINGTEYGAGANVMSLSDTEGGSVTAKVTWRTNNYTVYYHVNDGHGYNADWTTRSVPYGGSIDTSLNPQGAINSFRRFEGWNDVPSSMPANDVRINARISDYMCMIVTGHEKYAHVASFVPKFNQAGYWGTNINPVGFGNYYQVVTNQDMSYWRANDVFNYVWNNTPASYGTYFLVWGYISCNNGQTISRCRAWAC